MRIVPLSGCLGAALALVLAGPPWLAGPCAAGDAAGPVIVSAGTAGDLQEILESAATGPEHLAALEEAAVRLVAAGDVIRADRAYARLLDLTLDNPAAALGYAAARLHLRQEYEAQAALLAAAKSGEKGADETAAAVAALESAHAADALPGLLRDQFPEPARAGAVAAVIDLWDGVAASPGTAAPASGRSRRSPSAVLGSHHTRSYLALFCGYAAIARGDDATARNEMRAAIETAPDEGTAFLARTGYKLLDGLEAGADFRGLLDAAYQVSLERYSPLHTADGVFPLLDRMNGLVRDGDLDGAEAMLESFRRLPLDPMQGGRYFYYRGELRLAQGLDGLAVQNFHAARAVSDEPPIISNALFALAKDAARGGNRDEAVRYAALAADAAADLGYRQRDVADFLSELGRGEEALVYRERAVTAADSLQAAAQGYYELAERYRALGETAAGETAAGNFIATVERMGDAATAEERGLAAMYRGARLASAGAAVESREAYEEAASLVTDPHRLAEIHYLLAEDHAARGDTASAAASAEASLAALPDEDWKVRQIADFFDRTGMPERAVRVYEDALARTAGTGTEAERAILRTLAERSGASGEEERFLHYAARYRDAVQSAAPAANGADKGLAAFYDAAVRLASGDRDGAHQADTVAAALLDDPLRRYEVLDRMAGYEAARGDRDAAAAYAEEAAAARQEEWVFRRTGDFFFALSMPDRAYTYYDRAARMADPQDTASAYAVMADAYHAAGDAEAFERYAGMYVDAVDAKTDATPAETGLAAFHRSRRLSAEGKHDEAFAAAGVAAELLADPGRRAEALMRVAEYQADRGDDEAALASARASLALFPDADWKIREAADLLVRLGNPDEAVALHEARLDRAVTTRERAGAFRDLAGLLARLQRRDGELRYAARYRDSVASDTAEFTPAERGLAHYYDGEIRLAAGDGDAAARAYREAAQLLDDPLLLSDAYHKLAEHAAADGRPGEARDYALRSAGARPEDWVLTRTGHFLLALDMPDLALDAFDQAVKLADPDDDATAYAILADAYRDQGDAANFARYAGRYADAVDADADAAPAKRGLAAYYRGRIALAAGDRRKAFRAYEEAAGMLDDPATLYELYTFMAEESARQGQLERTVYYAGKSLEAATGEDWRLLDVAGLLLRAGLEAEAVSLYTRLAATAGSAQAQAGAVDALADLHKRLGNTDGYRRAAERYRELAASPALAGNAAVRGKAAFHHGEILAAGARPGEALAAYREAAELLDDPLLLAGIAHAMAVLHREQGDATEAARLAERSAALRPEEWVLRRTGYFLLELDKPEAAFPYLDRAARMAAAGDSAGAYAAMADWYGNQNDPERQARYAERYAAAVDAKGAAATPDERGLAGYYRAKRLLAEGDGDAAFEAFSRAAPLLSGADRRAEALMAMAEHMLGTGDNGRAVAYAEQSLEALPHERWKMREAGDLYIRAGEPDKAIALYTASLDAAATPRERADAARDLAGLHKRLDRRDGYLRYAALYRDLASVPGFVPGDGEKGLGLFYDGEILLAGGDRDGAYRAYAAAAETLTDALLASDALFVLAEMEAENGNPARAAELAERSAALRPEAWVLRRTGDFLFRLDKPDGAYAYYRRSAGMETPGNESAADAIMADAYSGRGDAERFGRYARRYAAAVAGKGGDATGAEQGLAAYYRGRVLAGDGEVDAAQAEYETAAALLEDRHKRSEVFRLMAAHQAELGDNERAAGYAEQSLDLLPDEFWLRNHVAGFYADIGRPEDGIRHLEAYAAATEDIRARAEAHLALAELHRRGENTGQFIHYAGLYTDAVVQPAFAATDDDLGNREFYLGEIAAAEQRFDDANRHYIAASHLYTDPNRLSEAVMKQAEYHGMRENRLEAARLAELSGSHIPNAVWRQLNVANFLGGLDQEDRAMCAFTRAMAMAETPGDQAQVYWAMANYHRGRAEPEEFVRCAKAYVNTVWGMGKRATRQEKGQCYYFIGEVHAHMREPHRAYAAYERAAGLITEPYLLSTIYFAMARYNAEHGDPARANSLALAGAGLLPDKRWVVAEAMGILADLKDFAAAEEIAMLAIYLDPENQGLYQTLAFIYFDKIGDRKRASRYHKKYIDYLYDRNDRAPQPAAKSLREELWYAKGGQNGIDRTWGLESYYTFNRWATGDYWSGMSHQLYRNYYLKNGWFGKAYLQYGGTFDSQFTSYHWVSEFERHRNVSRSHLEETGYLIFGATLHPFPRKWLNGFELWAEYHMGLGRNVDNDFRAGMKYTLVEGEWLRPSGNVWHYYKSETNVWYSWEDKVGNMNGELRQGMVYVNDCDRNLLFIPYGLVSYNYDGMNKENHFGSDAGVALMIKKYFREDRYHNPRSTVDVTVSYRWPLTRGRDPVLGISVCTNF